MAETITHAFVSAKSDSPDTTLVSATEWNAAHVLSGGINGQVFVYDNTQPNNIRWTDGAKIYNNTYTVPSSTPSPILNVAGITFTPNSPVIFSISVTLEDFSTSGALPLTFTLKLDGNSINTIIVLSEVTRITGYTIYNTTTAGAHTINMSIAAPSNILTGAVFLALFTTGI